MNKFNDILHSFIYVELYKLTMLGILRQSDSELIESKIRKSISDNFKENFYIELEYKDVLHGYSGEWRVYTKKRNLLKKRYALMFNLYDEKFTLHKKNLRKLTIDNILT